MFEKFIFSVQQIKKYWDKAVRDFHLAEQAKEIEIIFVFTYEAMLKIAITICARNNLRVKAYRGHHVELINKISEILKNEEIKQIGNEMRMKRNSGLYLGGDTVTYKEANFYRKFVKQILKEADIYLFPNKLL